MSVEDAILVVLGAVLYHSAKPYVQSFLSGTMYKLAGLGAGFFLAIKGKGKEKFLGSGIAAGAGVELYEEVMA